MRHFQAHRSQKGIYLCRNQEHLPEKLREKHNMSQRLLAYQLQLNGYDMDKNVITRIETNKRYVTDVELKALSEIFHVSYDYLIDGKEDEI